MLRSMLVLLVSSAGALPAVAQLGIPRPATREVIVRVQAEGTCWAGGAVWQGQQAMRISVSNWSTTEADVDRSVEAILRVAGA